MPEKKDMALNKSFYLAEAFFGTGDSEQSMNALAPKLLEAKTQDEIEAVYRQYIIDHQSLGKDMTLLEIAIRDHYSQQEGYDEPTPLYAKWLYYTVRTASAFLELYTVCLRVVRRESKKSAVINIMDMLYFADKAFEQMLTEIKNKEFTLREVYDHFRPLHSDYYDIPNFPLVFLFREFQEKHADNLRQKYGCPYHQTSIQERFQYRYWEDFEAVNTAEVERDIRDLLWAAAVESKNYDVIRYTIKSWQGEDRTVTIITDDYKDDLKHLKQMDDQWLAEKILSILDRHIEKRLSDGVQFRLNSATGEINVTSGCIEIALFLWIITQIQNTEDYRICKICGQVFKVRSQKTRQYCYSHPKAAIDYFNRKLRKQEQESDGQEEDARIMAV